MMVGMNIWQQQQHSQHKVDDDQPQCCGTGFPPSCMTGDTRMLLCNITAPA
jgi:hypothetical protein